MQEATGAPVAAAEDMQRVLAQAKAGETVTLTLAPNAKRKTIKRTPRGPVFVPQLSRMFRDDDGHSVHELQLPMFVLSPHESEWTIRNATATDRPIVMLMLQSHLRGVDRVWIEHLSFTRIAPKKLDRKDRLAQAFAGHVDTVCAWIVDGGLIGSARAIGHKDNEVFEKRGVGCDYFQEQQGKMKGWRLSIRMRVTAT